MNFDNLTIGEVITLEDMCGVSLSQIEESRSDGRVLRALVYIVAKRDGREMSIAEIDALPVSETNEILAPLMGETRPM
jgi:hypothetical protein